MILRTKFLAAALVLTAASGVAWATLGGLGSFFHGAPAGVSIPATPIALPPVIWQPNQVIPPTLAFKNGFNPGVDDLLMGENVITNERQMRYVWNRLFAGPYNPTLFDFQHTFVVLVGGGVQDIGSFDISSVEQVDAEYQGGFVSGTVTDRFLAVTSTVFFPGQPPPFPPPPYYALSAVSVPIAYFDDVVFHRNFFGAP